MNASAQWKDNYTIPPSSSDAMALVAVYNGQTISWL